MTNKNSIIVDANSEDHPIEDGRPSYLRAVDKLRSEIIDGVLKPGSRLKTEELARRLGVSIQPIREALQVLHGESLIVLEPNRGATVRGLDDSRLEHIYGVREAIEGYLTRRFAEEASLSDIRHLEEIQARHDAAVDAKNVQQVIETNMLFHRYICEHSKNDEALSIQQRYIALGVSIRRRFKADPERFAKVQRDHHNLIDAFHRRDGLEAYLIASRRVNDAKVELIKKIQIEKMGTPV